MAVHRDISHSELGKALTCEAQWDFSYGGHLTGGDTLDPRGLSSHLGSGRAWGAGVAAWHASPDGAMTVSDVPGLWAGHKAIGDSLEADAAKMYDDGTGVDLESLVARRDYLSAALTHYATYAEKLSNVTRLEGELLVPIPSRTGKRISSKYRFHGYVDCMSSGVGLDIVEFKWRDSLTDPELLALDRQPLRYAWAAQRQLGVVIGRVIVEERLSVIPKPVKIVNAKRKGEGIDGKTVSHDKQQITTEALYVEACALYGVDPHEDTLEAICGRRWSQRIPLMFTQTDLEIAGRELVSAAKLIHSLDSGDRFPIRNTKAMICRGCDYKRICAHPEDRTFVDMLFTRGTPKRLKDERIAA